MKGVVDSGDLPLNVSREMLQEDREVEAIRAAITRRVLDMLERLATEEPARYAEALAPYRLFWYEEAGDPPEGLAPGTRWSDIPADWICPLCGTPKSDFDMVEF